MPDLEEFAEIDRLAEERANKRGTRPNIDPPQVVLIAAGVFMLLYVFARIAMSDADAESAILPALVLTGVVAGAIYLAGRLQQKRWFERYHEALREIENERRGRQGHPVA